MPDLLTIEVSRTFDEVVIALVGELDISTCQRVTETLSAVEQIPARRLVIDLSELSFLDSTGLAIFLAIDKQCRQNAGPLLEIRPGPPAVQRLFEIIGAAHRLPFSTADGPKATA